MPRHCFYLKRKRFGMLTVLSAESGGKQKTHPTNGWSFLTENWRRFAARFSTLNSKFELRFAEPFVERCVQRKWSSFNNSICGDQSWRLLHRIAPRCCIVPRRVVVACRAVSRRLSQVIAGCDVLHGVILECVPVHLLANFVL